MADLSSIAVLKCGDWVGTSEVIAPDTVITAFHVIDHGEACTINGRPAFASFASRSLDFAVLRSPTYAAYEYPVDCRGYVPGMLYFAIGYARGHFILNPLIATHYLVDTTDKEGHQPLTHMRVLLGSVYQGMSGGPIVDIEGNLVGIINANNDTKTITWSRELRDSPLCQK